MTAPFFNNMRNSKFNVSKDASNRTYDGVVFDSALEMRFYRDVVIPKMETGEITKCERQVPYKLQDSFRRVNSLGKNQLIRQIDYVADFVLTYQDGHTQVIDTKGYPDSVALMKRKMFWFLYPNVDYRWIAYSKIDGGWVEYEVLKQNRAQRKRQKKKQNLTT